MESCKPYAVFLADKTHACKDTRNPLVGEFTTLEEAIQQCYDLIDRELRALYEPEDSPQKLFDNYACQANEPFIVIEGTVSDFCAWHYIWSRCHALFNAQALQLNLEAHIDSLPRHGRRSP